MFKTNFLKYKEYKTVRYGGVPFKVQHLGGQRQPSLVYITGPRPARVTQ